MMAGSVASRKLQHHSTAGEQQRSGKRELRHCGTLSTLMGEPPPPGASRRQEKAAKAILVTLGVALSLLMLLVVIVIGVCAN